MKCSEGFNANLDDGTVRLCSHSEYSLEQEAVMAEIDCVKWDTLKVIKGICDAHLMEMDPVERWSIVMHRTKKRILENVISFNDFKSKKQSTY